MDLLKHERGTSHKQFSLRWLPEESTILGFTQVVAVAWPEPPFCGLRMQFGFEKVHREIIKFRTCVAKWPVR